MPEPRTAGPLRVFLSYGHDSNEELVHRSKTELEASGHEVWFDKSEIKAGDDWRRSITEGISNSNRVLSFLSKHSRTGDALQKRPDADRLVEQILEKSEGVFLYVERFCDDVHRGCSLASLTLVVPDIGAFSNEMVIGHRRFGQHV